MPPQNKNKIGIKKWFTTISLVLVLGVGVNLGGMQIVTAQEVAGPPAPVTAPPEYTGSQGVTANEYYNNQEAINADSGWLNGLGGLLGSIAEGLKDLGIWLLEKLWSAIRSGAEKGFDILKEVGVMTFKNYTNKLIDSLYEGAIKEFENAYLIQDYKKLSEDVAYKAVYHFNNDLLLNENVLGGSKLPLEAISAIKDIETMMQGKIAEELYNAGHAFTTNTLKKLSASDPQPSMYIGKDQYYIALADQSNSNAYSKTVGIQQQVLGLEADAEKDTERQKAAGIVDDNGSESSSTGNTILEKDDKFSKETFSSALSSMGYENIARAPASTETGKYYFNSKNESYYITPVNYQNEVLVIKMDSFGGYVLIDMEVGELTRFLQEDMGYTESSSTPAYNDAGKYFYNSKAEKVVATLVNQPNETTSFEIVSGKVDSISTSGSGEKFTSMYVSPVPSSDMLHQVVSITKLSDNSEIKQAYISPVVNERSKETDWNSLVKHPAGYLKDQLKNLVESRSNNLINNDGKTVDFIQSTLANIASSMVNFEFGVTRDSDGCPTGITGNITGSKTGELQAMKPPSSNYKCVAKMFGWMYDKLGGLACKVLRFLGINAGFCAGEDVFAQDVNGSVGSSMPKVSGFYDFEFASGMEGAHSAAFRVFRDKGGFENEEQVKSYMSENFAWDDFGSGSSAGQFLDSKEVVAGEIIPPAGNTAPDYAGMIYQSPIIEAGTGLHRYYWPGVDLQGNFVDNGNYWIVYYFDKNGQERFDYVFFAKGKTEFIERPAIDTDLYAHITSPDVSPGPEYINYMESDLRYQTVYLGESVELKASAFDYSGKDLPANLNAIVRVQKFLAWEGAGDDGENKTPEAQRILDEAYSNTDPIIISGRRELLVNNGSVKFTLKTGESGHFMETPGIYLVNFILDVAVTYDENGTYQGWDMGGFIEEINEENNSTYMFLNVLPASN